MGDERGCADVHATNDDRCFSIIHHNLRIFMNIFSAAKSILTGVAVWVYGNGRSISKSQRVGRSLAGSA
jgi:hypothetical protein